MRAEGRSTTGNPSRARVELFKLPPSWGGAGLLSLSEQADLAAVGRVFRLPTSPDPKVALQDRLCWTSLYCLSGCWTRHVPQRKEDEEFLCHHHILCGLNSKEPPFQAAVISDGGFRRELALLGIECAEGPGVSESGYSCRQAGLRQSGGDNPMHLEVTHTRFADWGLFYRARLKTLPINECQWWSNEEHRGELRLDSTAPFEELLPDVEDVASCRLDKIIRIVDITVPCKDGWQSVTAARENKLHKYEYVCSAVLGYDFCGRIHGGIPRCLDSANWITLSHMGVDSRKGSAIVEAIKLSQGIY
ncbi:hypothetical protein J6590_000500 [Homalodisca vitripennis]|nr:hypothetical protein J6590_000500 [Homalodisca vitripennis]